MDYYLSSHMPLVGKHLTPMGLTGWKVLDFGKDADFCVQATLDWDSQASFEKAAATPEMKEIMEDVPNFADKQPTMLPGAVKATS
ncbi:hypothetical protein LTR56_017616 [Elasticomyces elasticus]|uniref:EthD domain-containing protein n=1 Tax=Elasticomyces elasticus TaxID=574655 RepID=A0AAN7VR32_9PEZI|nr:hypothetical protein LTR56_025326 [Elasticomyces elasticus]KAK3619138.1 hypothetical protein LTR22_026097 [Elasticomyces elasticus]KAK3621236.1 hypothetical protein LTR22_025281 [Elasticomyces elasticus]KAK3630202.1 hypothetical protein LTR56_017616 [Elasticomyces elasticus]KAK4899105.1 hypothetical protein LTR27_003335 [Elasticomyces elasticus]